MSPAHPTSRTAAKEDGKAVAKRVVNNLGTIVGEEAGSPETGHEPAGAHGR